MASLTLYLDKSMKPNSNPTKCSVQMDLLYGKERANQVWQYLEDLDPQLNKEIQAIACDHYWALPGLLLKEKSLVTVTSLIALNKEEQTKIHLHGLLHQGISLPQLASMMNCIKNKISAESSKKAISVVLEVVHEKDYSEEALENFKALLLKTTCDLADREKFIIEVALASALGNAKAALTKFMDVFPLEDFKAIFIHQIVYCGFPTAVNSFSALKALRG